MRTLQLYRLFCLANSHCSLTDFIQLRHWGQGSVTTQEVQYHPKRRPGIAARWTGTTSIRDHTISCQYVTPDKPKPRYCPWNHSQICSSSRELTVPTFFKPVEILPAGLGARSVFLVQIHVEAYMLTLGNPQSVNCSRSSYGSCLSSCLEFAKTR